MVGLEIVHLFIESVHPERLTDKNNSVQLILKAWHVPGYPLHQPLSYFVSQLLQFLDDYLLGWFLL